MYIALGAPPVAPKTPSRQLNGQVVGSESFQVYSEPYPPFELRKRSAPPVEVTFGSEAGKEAAPAAYPALAPLSPDEANTLIPAAAACS